MCPIYNNLNKRDFFCKTKQNEWIVTNIINSNIHILDILLSFAYNDGCQSRVALHDLLLSKNKSSVIISSRRHSSYNKVESACQKRDNKKALVTA